MSKDVKDLPAWLRTKNDEVFTLQWVIAAARATGNLFSTPYEADMAPEGEGEAPRLRLEKDVWLVLRPAELSEQYFIEGVDYLAVHADVESPGMSNYHRRQPYIGTMVETIAAELGTTIHWNSDDPEVTLEF